MLKLSQQQLNERWDKMPARLKEILCDYETSQKVRNICNFYHLNDERIRIVADLIGEVLMGFLAIDDFKNCLSQDLSILGQTIINSLDERIQKEIFAPIRREIEQNYAPVVEEIKTETKKEEEKREEKKVAPEIKPSTQPIKIENKGIDLKEIKREAKQEEQKGTEFKIKKEVTKIKDKGPFMLFKRKRPKPKRPLSFWFKQEIKKEKEPIKTEVEIPGEKEKKKEIKKGEIKQEEKQTIEYQKPKEKKSPFKNKY